MWAMNDVTLKGKWSVPWLFIISLATVLTVFEMTVSPAPMGDEIFQTFALGIVLWLLGSVAAILYARPVLNASIFTVFFCCGHLSVWFKVAQRNRYASFGPQFWAGLVLTLIFFGLSLLSGECIKFLLKRIRQWCQAT
jgi:hypothetical protein